ncbi:hypothetical protein PTMSG1_07936 [Pyrenophora teres f. maculata]|nr:hypothetical protein PTMSG1_07936 [Pyrenophora teres f. maculata]
MSTAETYQGDQVLPHDVLPRHSVFPFLQLPRELRDQIYDYAFAIQHHHGQRPIERRNLKYFKPSAASILLVTRHDYFLLNRQVAREALQVLFKHHTVFLSSGPFVLKAILEKIEEPNGPGRQWLKWLRKIQLDWVTFPSLQHYPPEMNEWRDDSHWEHDTAEVDVDLIRGAYYNGHYDEYDHEGIHYEDNYYDPGNSSLYPSFHPPSTSTAQTADDPFGFATHYPFTDPTRDPVREASAADISSKLDLLVSLEVTPLFTYLASPTFNLHSITLPLAFISRSSHHQRSASRPGYALPLKIRYWVKVCAHALLMLISPTHDAAAHPSLEEVRVKYAPADIWASMEPADDLPRMVTAGVWFDEDEDAEGGGGGGGGRQGQGEAFRAVWDTVHASLSQQQVASLGPRFGLQAKIALVAWDGDMDSGRLGDELEVVFSRHVAAQA